jgi:uncharacterized protein (DUF2147 family)
MKFLGALFIILPVCASSQSIVGKWKTIDDNTGEQRSIVEIYETGGKIKGKVVKIFPGPNDDPDPVCDKCSSDDPRFNKRIIGMEIIRDMVKDGDEYEDGDILDPENGKVYRCKLWVEGDDLKVRGYWGPFFRTQTWKKSE